MEIIHEWQNGPELLISFVEGQDAKKELMWLEPILEEPDETGAATRDDGSIKKENRGIFFKKIFFPLYGKCSPTIKIIEQFIRQAIEQSFTPNSVFQSLHTLQGYDVLFSAYRDGDHYEAHRDGSKLTLLFWLGEKNFEGGDLYLPDFDYTIPYEPNKLVMFPSYYQHEVTPISTEKEGFVRYCASAFIN